MLGKPLSLANINMLIAAAKIARDYHAWTVFSDGDTSEVTMGARSLLSVMKEAGTTATVKASSAGSYEASTHYGGVKFTAIIHPDEFLQFGYTAPRPPQPEQAPVAVQ